MQYLENHNQVARVSSKCSPQYFTYIEREELQRSSWQNTQKQ